LTEVFRYYDLAKQVVVLHALSLLIMREN
jgi:hypothetical protein